MKRMNSTWRTGAAGIAMLLFCGSVALATPPRPVVVIPGVLGSRLCEGDEVLWGTRSSYRNFSRLALPVDPGDTSVRPCGIIDEVRILGPWKTEQYDPLLDRLRGLGYREGRTLFVFDYDWRQSNYDSARALERFVASQPGLARGEFDIVAHSMGGIVARIYLERHSGADRVHSFVTLGTPHRGSLKILDMLLSGFGGLGDFMAGGADEVKRVAFTFPSAFELLPFYDNCCVRGLPGQADRRVFDILDERYWLSAWAPAEYRSGPRRERIRSHLARARELRVLLRAPVTSGVELYPFAGTFVDTLSQVYVDPESLSPEVWKKTNGDGSVLVTSAAGDRVDQARVSFTQHSALFRDAHVRVALEWILIRPAGPVDFAGGDAEIFVLAGEERELIPIERLSFEVTPSFVAPGCEVDVRLELRGGFAKPARGVEVEAWIESEDGARSPIELAEDPSLRTGEEDPTAYFTAEVRPTAAGSHRIVVEAPGLGKELEEFFVVVAPAAQEEEEETPCAP